MTNVSNTAINTNGTLSTEASGNLGTAQFQVTATDSAGGISDPLIMSITIGPHTADFAEPDNQFLDAKPDVVASVSSFPIDRTFHEPNDEDWIVFYHLFNLPRRKCFCKSKDCYFQRPE